MRLISAWLLVCLGLLFFITGTVSAQTQYEFPKASEGQINEAIQGLVPLRFLPTHPFYFLISAKETFNRFFQPSSAKKAEFDLLLSGKRLKETYLLLDKNNTKRANNNLNRYGQRIDKMIGQLEKARSQNQDVVTLASKIAEDLRYHEILFFAIDQKRRNFEVDTGFDQNFEKAASDFIKVVMAIDNIKPGLKDRFPTVTNTNNGTESIDIPTPTPTTEILESSPSVRPRRIIY